ncbi:MAG: hypothetical protein AUJ34_03075 [Parcubacteria group bacterium CG1_02_41_12]|nr:MAG: hypothetical protein AUJ34_03075 [Parcubacteria group bacterium CG1_02_41_12]PIR57397.1 MAG: hypothetical protein COU72_01125 [Parcubacteria group bacterium CG10_big_fil_rev_8_21_14_0_10_41_35]PIZ81666.1 MAG: hypothetical protein COY02_01115 [Parcubacteria group bacterium CG_4_10_14_0_2_um_filter_41_6]
MTKSNLSKSKTSISTQQYLDIAEIKDDVVILRDGSIRKVLIASSINFALKSEDEQNAIISGYISFLNSLSFSVQIVIQSRQLNIDGYLEQLKQKEQEQTNELLHVQVQEYRAFISQLIELGDIMGKRFYIVIPYKPGKDARKGFVSQLGAVFSPAKVITLSEKIFSQYIEKLDTRVNTVIGSLSGIGVTAVPLDTRNLIELYYSSYNPELAQLEKLPKQEDLDID